MQQEVAGIQYSNCTVRSLSYQFCVIVCAVTQSLFIALLMDIGRYNIRFKLAYSIPS